MLLANEKEKIVFFDGDCNLCSGTVQFLIRTNAKNNLKFAALQSVYFQEHFPTLKDKRESVLYLSDGILYSKSDAALQITRELKFPFYLLFFFKIIPRLIRDFFYQIIAKYRYFIFGTRSSCLISIPNYTDRFLS
ncbi:MAG: DCC1-like thiol-disulfide oxidoreductase family protein [Leptospira sp.]|nr:DCC1-like thiol-disulfide oxidoreductase family protein [Leptospira sp.]